MSAPVVVREAVRTREARKHGVRHRRQHKGRRCRQSAPHPHHNGPDSSGSQLDHSAHDRISSRNPRARTNDRKITAASVSPRTVDPAGHGGWGHVASADICKERRSLLVANDGAPWVRWYDEPILRRPMRRRQWDVVRTVRYTTNSSQRQPRAGYLLVGRGCRCLC